jgi:chemotaxis protein MotB
MARKKRPEEPEKPENAERYMLTYSDMITLLMTFFIVLYAMATPSQAKYEALAESLSTAFSGMPGIQAQGSGGYAFFNRNASLRSAPGTGLSQKASKKTTPFLQRATSTLQSEINLGEFRINTEARGVVVGLSGDVFFREGQAGLNSDALAKLEPVAELLRSVSQPIVVEGFSDNTPMDPGSRYNSNLGLSAARAVSVAEALELLGVPKERVSAAGYGDAQPMRSNDTPEGRAYNRRVDILIRFDEE